MIEPMFIRKFLPDEICNFVYNYCILKFSQEEEIEDRIDFQTHSFISRYGDPVMETILDMTTPVIEQNVGKKLWPANSFFRIYDKTSDLPIHTDRGSCEYTIALCLGAQPSDKPYNIYLGELDPNSDYGYFYDDKKWEKVKIEHKFPMLPNDALIFQGVNKVHWREYCEHDHYITVFLHYVEQEGEYKHLKFDKRRSLGAPKAHD